MFDVHVQWKGLWAPNTYYMNKLTKTDFWTDLFLTEDSEVELSTLCWFRIEKIKESSRKRRKYWGNDRSKDRSKEVIHEKLKRKVKESRKSINWEEKENNNKTY